MRHRYKTKKLGRPRGHRESMLSNQVSSLIRYEHITTTKAKGMQTKALFDKAMTVAKKKTDHAKRHLKTFVKDPLAVDKLTEVLIERYKDVNSGFCKVFRVGTRKGDNAPLVRLVLLEEEKEVTIKKDKKSKLKTKKTEK